MARWAARQLTDIPQIPVDEGEPAWHPVQHYFGLTAFGANAYVAAGEGVTLVEEHDESETDQEELYVVTAGRATFVVDGKSVDAVAGTAVAVADPHLSRSAVASEAGTVLLAFGGPAREQFESSWHPRHFEGIPQAPQPGNGQP